VLTENLWREEEKGVFEDLWKSPAPSKVVAFAWKVLRNRIPTKVNLALRNVLGPDQNNLCTFCNRVEESSVHLFLHCDFTSSVWLSIMSWLDRFFPTPPNLFVHWECWSGRERKKIGKKGLWLIWNSTVWALWKARNDKIFKGIIYTANEIADEIRVMSWRWFLSRMSVPSCLFYEWCWNPFECLNRNLLTR
jgi:hypothetical protein